MKLLSQRALGAALVFFTSAVLFAQAVPPAGAKPAADTKQADAPPPPAVHKQPAAHAAQDNPGERAFQTNCSRCHSAPDNLPPTVTGTIVRHMRVRANLSAEDESLILSYLNP